MPDLEQDGVVVFDDDPRVTRWATRAHEAACAITRDPVERRKWLRHGSTWFVGVDALGNGPDGAVDDADLAGPWAGQVDAPDVWHRAQISVVYPGYPKRDPDESEAAHRFRVVRCAAHVDGLHLEGGRRIVREPHSFILGLPLNDSDACPLVVWRGSHTMMRDALRAAIGAGDPIGADVTDIYKATRARVLEDCEPVDVQMGVGQSVLLDRFAVHGVAPWRDGMRAPKEGRMVAYFRPECRHPEDWLNG
ncbi:hypothetical protein L0664_05145 [Octadecabacter sp. G9-8]|uniref:Phytanoyl-CoA dioxygenase family protein n=1 Tax=Octadecabacter dasysiphoniae TaxID=2909341 RepID=A0ABS9CU44_9RHOB|nr:hypothetical protein [Octadecabacter dasysiphoniae]MCF2870446.1 hypothetical protein [Octadecabacter dasysiphoniae]